MPKNIEDIEELLQKKYSGLSEALKVEYNRQLKQVYELANVISTENFAHEILIEKKEKLLALKRALSILFSISLFIILIIGIITEKSVISELLLMLPAWIISSLLMRIYALPSLELEIREKAYRCQMLRSTGYGRVGYELMKSQVEYANRAEHPDGDLHYNKIKQEIIIRVTNMDLV